MIKKKKQNKTKKQKQKQNKTKQKASTFFFQLFCTQKNAKCGVNCGYLEQLRGIFNK